MATSPIKKASYYAKKWVFIPLQKKWYSRWQSRFSSDLSFTTAASKFPDRNSFHGYMHHYFYHFCPDVVREHRKYFTTNQRGFGEDAFHAMWWLLLREYKPRTCLEIGIYRGQVISLWALCSQILKYDCDVHGISPFSSLGDNFSKYIDDVNYLEDTLASFKYWKLPAPTLIKSLSTDREAVIHIKQHKWDLIYIDGSHDYEIAIQDYKLCRDHLNEGGLLVLDDASVGTSFRPPLFSFAGHPGPSTIAREFASKELDFLGAVGHNNIFRKCIYESK